MNLAVVFPVCSVAKTLTNFLISVVFHDLVGFLFILFLFLFFLSSWNLLEIGEQA